MKINFKKVPTMQKASSLQDNMLNLGGLRNNVVSLRII